MIRIAVRAEVARIVGCRDLIRSLDQEGARRRDPEAYNLAIRRFVSAFSRAFCPQRRRPDR